jgi:hypothetical protein
LYRSASLSFVTADGLPIAAVAALPLGCSDGCAFFCCFFRNQFITLPLDDRVKWFLFQLATVRCAW